MPKHEPCDQCGPRLLVAGGAIGGLWVKAGHPVLLSSHQPGELKDLVAGLGPLSSRSCR